MISEKPFPGIPHADAFRWEGIPLLPYKEDGNTFRGVSRQTLFLGEGDLPVELRYFEVDADGHSTLERHEHTHLVMIIRGSGEVFVADQVRPIHPHDVVRIPTLTWHQFRANQGEPLGFLCLVSPERDRPQRPTAEQLEELHRFPRAKEFLRF